jgi:hypothetical protein
MATLDEPLEVLEPPELIALAATIAARLTPTGEDSASTRP